MAGIYVHIPFCRSRCAYCDFYSTGLLHLRGRYVDAVLREMDLRSGYLSEPVSTVYLGGGTPSVLDAGDLGRLLGGILRGFRVAPGAEVTMECNPDDVTPRLVLSIAGIGVNRVSLGVQTFDDGRLRSVGRRHDAAAARRAVALLRDSGITNISVDLIFGFPGQTMEEWERDIRECLELGVGHVSAYGLAYEQGTPLWSMLQRGEVSEVPEELSLAMYATLAERLREAGYERYEISNFALPGMRSRHNGNYWREVPYLGLGAGAHSYDLESRQWNVSDIEGYIRAVGRGEVPAEREVLDSDTRFNDLVVRAMRTSSGLALAQVEGSLGRRYAEHLLQAAGPFISRGLLEERDGCLRLTPNGICLSDGIMAGLMVV